MESFFICNQEDDSSARFLTAHIPVKVMELYIDIRKEIGILFARTVKKCIILIISAMYAVTEGTLKVHYSNTLRPNHISSAIFSVVTFYLALIRSLQSISNNTTLMNAMPVRNHFKAKELSINTITQNTIELNISRLKLNLNQKTCLYIN